MILPSYFVFCQIWLNHLMNDHNLCYIKSLLKKLINYISKPSFWSFGFFTNKLHWVLIGFWQNWPTTCEKKCGSNFLIIEDGTLCGWNWNKTSKAKGLQLTVKVLHPCSVFGWLNFASWQQNKSPSLWCVQRLVLGEKIAHCHHVMRKLFLNYPYLSSSM